MKFKENIEPNNPDIFYVIINHNTQVQVRLKHSRGEICQGVSFRTIPVPYDRPVH